MEAKPTGRPTPLPAGDDEFGLVAVATTVAGVTIAAAATAAADLFNAYLEEINATFWMGCMWNRPTKGKVQKWDREDWVCGGNHECGRGNKKLVFPYNN